MKYFGGIKIYHIFMCQLENILRRHNIRTLAKPNNTLNKLLGSVNKDKIFLEVMGKSYIT